MRSIFIGFLIFMGATIIVSLNIRHETVAPSTVFVPFARETPTLTPTPADSALDPEPTPWSNQDTTKDGHHD